MKKSGCSLQSGLGTAVFAPCNLKNGKLIRPISPPARYRQTVEVLSLQQRGSGAYKRKTGEELNVLYWHCVPNNVSVLAAFKQQVSLRNF
ncbi:MULTISPECIES: hypothetical protein [unclassified Pedobacter]|uniref:hypothetical protein n=1 Tax=unclassified Pedobacter TaxID=2628915 RepID=UPI001420BBC9|nr:MULTISPECIES: hypothetical protein [unclassified Pedobacter]NII83340.1 hypothetical protein [Pedobacter sp. SG908]NMN37206.1 hypothetical protein [Pedobacter sp. SG918]